jgi:hypothetical protein
MKARSVVIVALLSGCGASHGWSKVGHQTYVVWCRDLADCYKEIRGRCPYGTAPLASQTTTTGATAVSTGDPSTGVVTTVTKRNKTEMAVKCRDAVFCETQADCEGTGLPCVQSKRYPGRATCADR